MISKRLTVAFTFLVSASAFAWDGWYEKAYNGTNFTADVFRLAENDEPEITLYGGRMQESYQHEVAQGDLRTFTVDMYDGFVESIPPWGSTSYVTRVFVTDRYHKRTSDNGDTYYIISNVVYTFTANVARVAVQNQRVQARDVWAIDAIRAIRERKAAVGLDIKNTYDIVFYNRNRDVLVWAKDEIKTLASQFVDPQPSTGFVFSGSFEIGDEHYPRGFDSIQELCQRVGAPDNYFDYTPWVEIGGREKNDTNIYTNAQIPDILPGKTHLDYGWKYIRPMLTNLHITTGSVIAKGGREAQTRIKCVELGDGNGALYEAENIDEYRLWVGANTMDLLLFDCSGWSSAQNFEITQQIGSGGIGVYVDLFLALLIEWDNAGEFDFARASYWGCRDEVYDDRSTPENEAVPGSDPLWATVNRSKTEYYKPCIMYFGETNVSHILKDMKPEYVVYELRTSGDYISVPGGVIDGNYEEVSGDFLKDYGDTTNKYVFMFEGTMQTPEEYIVDEVKCAGGIYGGIQRGESIARNASTSVVFVGSSYSHYNQLPPVPPGWKTQDPYREIPVMLWDLDEIRWAFPPSYSSWRDIQWGIGVDPLPIIDWTGGGNAFKYR